MAPLDSTATVRTVNARGWDGLHWDGCEVAIMASGESLSVEQCEAVRAWRAASPKSRKAIVINTTFRRALWADVLYACDKPWWEGRDRVDKPTYLQEARATFAGEFWTQDADAARSYGIRRVNSEAGNGLSRKIGVVKQGANGGYQAIGLAYWAGASTVYLLGYDMHGRHWHGDHPHPLNKPNRFDIFLKNFGTLAADVAREKNFRVINCTPGSALKSFPMQDWKEVFA